MIAYLKALLRRTFPADNSMDLRAADSPPDPIAVDLHQAVQDHLDAGAAERAAYADSTRKMRATIDQLLKRMDKQDAR